MAAAVRWLLSVAVCAAVATLTAAAETVRQLEVSEGAPIGTRVGWIGEPGRYVIVPEPGSPVDECFSIDALTTEIRTKVKLDRETRATYSLVAITQERNIRVVIRVLDENDNAPTFPTDVMHIEFPENTPREVKRTLQPARDPDLGSFSTQRYSILSGNVKNAFKLSSHEERDGVLYLDLQIVGPLDRETTSSYSLVIEAVDGGTPPLRGTMTVNITILDVNDNQPLFNQSRYFATIPENATVATPVLQVFATDADAGDNGLVEYSINRRQSDREAMFRIHPSTGVIAVNRQLDFESKEVHELVVVARDHGLQPLETTTFVSIKVTDVNDNQPTINLIFLSDDATPKISESARQGEFVARISVHDPDSRTEYSHVNVTLKGGDGRFGLQKRDNLIYLVIVSLPLDREAQPNYTLSVIATDTGTPPLHASKTFHLRVTDVNDNAPEFSSHVYRATVPEKAGVGSPVVQVTATDRDEGGNAEVRYSLLDTADSHSDWFEIDPKSGLISLKSRVDCETDPEPHLTVIASDNGVPSLSSSATVIVEVLDVNNNEPIFDQSFYNRSISEAEALGSCILQVSATDPDCGVSSKVNYSLPDPSFFSVSADTGEICIVSPLDHETKNSFELAVVATDRGGKNTTAMVKIQIIDVNDNQPLFSPREYNVTLRQDALDGINGEVGPIVAVVATDRDSGHFGEVSFATESSTAPPGAFRVDRRTGDVFLARPELVHTAGGRYVLTVSAIDGGGLRATRDAVVNVAVVADKDPERRPPVFEMPRYAFNVRENVPSGTTVGSVRAVGGAGGVKYSLHSGDPEGYLTVDPSTGALKTVGLLDHELYQSVLLNVQATTGDPPSFGHTQVLITIDDVNDNPPEFDSPSVHISVAENIAISTTIYVAHARDRDSGVNGEVTYRLLENGPTTFRVDSRLGLVTLIRPLDFEKASRHSVVLVATDGGSPSLSANLTVNVDVQDVNDNAPVFERESYSVAVSESKSIGSQILRVTAQDTDTGSNARVSYRLIGDDTGPVTIASSTGWLQLRDVLDRESQDHYKFGVVARDAGVPSFEATATVTLTVLDANDNDPVFAAPGYEFAVEENSPAGTIVGILAALDADADVNAEIRFSLVQASHLFDVDPLTGVMTTREVLDREARAEHELVGEARDGGSPPRTARVRVRVRVLDVNDNEPVLVDPPGDVMSVREELPAGTVVGRARGVDADVGENATITYAIEPERDADAADLAAVGLFSVDPQTGLIRTKAPLSHEERAVYRLRITATDRGYPPRTGVRVLRVEVLDVNDHRPTFASSSRVFQVPEDAHVGMVIGSLAADATDGEFVRQNTNEEPLVVFTVVSPSTDSALIVNRASGDIVVAAPLDRERHSTYRLEVRALAHGGINSGSDVHPRSSAISVTVQVQDVNDNAPFWSNDPVELEVREDALVGSVLANLTATDADDGVNGELRYTILEQWPSTSKPVFGLDVLTGTLTLLETLDFEALSAHLVVVAATDRATKNPKTTSMTVVVRVVDINDHTPEFVSPATQDVALVTKPGAIVGAVLAVDMDSGNNGKVSYSVADTRFVVDSSGILTLAPGAPSFQPGARIVVDVTATDAGDPPRSSTQKLTLAVRSPSGAPARFSRAEVQAEIAENARIGTFVARVSLAAGPGNATFRIPPGAADDAFVVDSVRGVISTKATLDRERRASYLLPVYAITSDQQSFEDVDDFTDLADVALVDVTVKDVNDHAPRFRHGACYPLAVPENGEEAVIHTVAAEDLDLGANGEVAYSITGGNSGSKFRIDPRTGELAALPLDRETQARYWLSITAQDHGTPDPLRSSCNITITVLDENDNDPSFAQTQYSAVVPEDVVVGAIVLTVGATDADAGVNSRLTYALEGETHWLFEIHNETGVITTAGPLDREMQSSFIFSVTATDGGKARARRASVPVTITVGDVNDESPVFAHHPLVVTASPSTQPGEAVARLQATDADEGANAELVYSFAEDAAPFRLDPSTGAITVTTPLTAETGRVFRLAVVARDRGNPPRSTQGLVEVRVGEPDAVAAGLRCQNATVETTVDEHSPLGADVVRVSAVRADGRRQRITYTIVSGDLHGALEIHPTSGHIKVKDSTKLDYETTQELRLVVDAEAGGLHAYCGAVVRLRDLNDNAPRFTQPVYSAAVLEGHSKGTHVVQVTAIDPDLQQLLSTTENESKLLYHIVDGNHDNAFIISPASSGMVKTNIVLDREIRDSYRLTVIATDQGSPQLSGTATIRISVIDVNDNRPTFPPHSVISVNEGREIGSVLTTVSANDVDTSPVLTYAFMSAEGDFLGPTSGPFALDRYSGRLTLIQPLDVEAETEYRLRVTASDSVYTAMTSLTVRVTDDNDHSPVFTRPAYAVSLPDGIDEAGALLTVNATDADSGANGDLRYSLRTATSGFWINERNGQLHVNRTADQLRPSVTASTSSPTSNGDVDLIVVATDQGNPPLSSAVPVRVRLGAGSTDSHEFNQEDYRLKVREDELPGKTLARLGSFRSFSQGSEQDMLYSIVDGNIGNVFAIRSPGGELLLSGRLDRETQDSYSLRVASGRRAAMRNTSAALLVKVTVDDANDNAPVIAKATYDARISEGVSPGHSVVTLTASDADLPGTPNSDLLFTITSGNDGHEFDVDPSSGTLTVKTALDFDAGLHKHVLVVRASDQGVPPLFSLAKVRLTVEDVNDNAPTFPLEDYLEFVRENEPPGTAVFTARAVDADRGAFGVVNYTISSGNSALFKIDPASGLLTTGARFDYEARTSYLLTVRATDAGGRFSEARVRVFVESYDEFTPQFSERVYRFRLPAAGALPAGFVVGRVEATDGDMGLDGRVVYQLNVQNRFFRMNRTSGVLSLKRRLDSPTAVLRSSSDLSFLVTAGTGRPGSLTNTSVVEITLATDAAAAVSGTGLNLDWILAVVGGILLLLLAAAALFAFVKVRGRRHKKVAKAAPPAATAPDTYCDPGVFDTIQIRGTGNTGPTAASTPFAPPKYDEIPAYRSNAPNSTAGAPTSEQSGSSGRGSAEEGEDEDEEIRMINEQRRRDGDSISDVSVHNTQQYLARLGIVHKPPAPCSQPTAPCVFDESADAEGDLSNLIYAKLQGGSERGSGSISVDEGAASVLFGDVDVATAGGAGGGTQQPSMTGSLSSIVHSEEELTGSYNWDYLLDWGPQYQPLAHVFSEIARLKDDAASVQSGASANSSTPAPSAPKTVPPPLLTSVAPRSIAAPFIAPRTGSNHGQSMAQLILLPRSPISHEAAGSTGTSAMSPSFSPSLSPLATRSPSLSPPSHHVVALPRTSAEMELRI